MNYWDSVGRWINTLLVFIVGVLAFDALFRLLEANEDNVIVASVRVLSVVFLVPFRGMFGEQDYLLTTLVGVLGYALLAGIALGVLRSLQASLAQPAPPVSPAPDSEQPELRITVEQDTAAPSAAWDDADGRHRTPDGGGRSRRPGHPAAPSHVSAASPSTEHVDAGSSGNGASKRGDAKDGGERSGARSPARDRASARQGPSSAPGSEAAL